MTLRRRRDIGFVEKINLGGNGSSDFGEEERNVR